jgi:hypothetical protein
MPGQEHPAARARVADSAVPSDQPAGPADATAGTDGAPGMTSHPPSRSLAARTNHPAVAKLRPEQRDHWKQRETNVLAHAHVRWREANDEHRGRLAERAGKLVASQAVDALSGSPAAAEPIEAANAQ